MKRAMLAMAALCLTTTGCATAGRSGLSATAISAGIDAAQARYDQVRAMAAPFVPWMPPVWQERVRLAALAVETLLETARTASTLAERQAALKDAAAATDTLSLVAGN